MEADRTEAATVLATEQSAISYADTIAIVGQRVSEARTAIKSAILYADLTEHERDSLISLTLDLLDVVNKANARS